MLQPVSTRPVATTNSFGKLPRGQNERISANLKPLTVTSDTGQKM